MISGQCIHRLEREGPAGTGLARMTLDPKDFQSQLPQQHVHVYFQDAALGLTVGVWTTTSMQETFGPYPGDEFMCILEGRVAMADGDGCETLVHAGQSFCIRNAIPISWKQVGFLRKFYMTYAPPGVPTPELTTAEGGVVVLDAAALEMGMTFDSSTGQAATGDGAPLERTSTAFTNAAGNFRVGLRAATAFQGSMRPSPAHEMRRMLAGELTVTEESGRLHQFVAGDVFFIPQGTVCSWHASAPVRTFYARLAPVVA